MILFWVRFVTRSGPKLDVPRNTGVPWEPQGFREELLKLEYKLRVKN